LGCWYKLCAEGSAELEKWVLERFKRLIEGHASDVAAGMRHSATRRGLSVTQRKAIDKSLNYFLERKGRMPCGVCLEVGTPIAIRVIASKYRTLIGDRLDITKAR